MKTHALVALLPTPAVWLTCTTPRLPSNAPSAMTAWRLGGAVAVAPGSVAPAVPASAASPLVA